MVNGALPKISVVIPNYNHGYCVGHALESVCSQDPPPHDVIVLDDCSTDNSVAVIQAFVTRYPFVRLIRYPQKSVDWLKAWAEHLPLLAGDFILSLGADDFIYPGFIREVSQIIRQYPQCGVVFTDWHLVDANRKVIGQTRSTVEAPCFLQGQQLVDQICKFNVFESSVGAVARKEHLLWINENNGAAMGPWNGSMGYPVIAMMQGACYIPCFLSASCHAPGPGRVNYTHRIFSDTRKATELYYVVAKFFRSIEIAPFVPPEMLQALEVKAMFCFNFEGRETVLWKRFTKRATTLINSGRLRLADEWLRQVTQVFPNQAEAYSDWGGVLIALGRPADAEAALQRAVELNPNIATAHCNWGVCLQARGAAAQAVAAYHRAAELDPQFDNAFANLGSALFTLNRFEEALQAQQRSVQLNPVAGDNFARLAKTFVALGRLEEAHQACFTAIELDPTQSEVRGTLDHVKNRLGLQGPEHQSGPGP